MERVLLQPIAAIISREHIANLNRRISFARRIPHPHLAAVHPFGKRRIVDLTLTDFVSR